MATMCPTTSAAYVNEHLQAVMTVGGVGLREGLKMDRKSGKRNTKNGREFPNYAAATEWKRALYV